MEPRALVICSPPASRTQPELKRQQTNGRVIMFFRDPGGEAGPALYTAEITGRNELRVPTPGYASDPAWWPLLSEARARGLGGFEPSY